jgi:hypothetical protein
MCRAMPEMYAYMHDVCRRIQHVRVNVPDFYVDNFPESDWNRALDCVNTPCTVFRTCGVCMSRVIEHTHIYLCGKAPTRSLYHDHLAAVINPRPSSKPVTIGTEKHPQIDTYNGFAITDSCTFYTEHAAIGDVRGRRQSLRPPPRRRSPCH